MRILYDSKNLKYKSPFGCIKEGENCRISIDIPQNCQTKAVFLQRLCFVFAKRTQNNIIIAKNHTFLHTLYHNAVDLSIAFAKIFWFLVVLCWICLDLATYRGALKCRKRSFYYNNLLYIGVGSKQNHLDCCCFWFGFAFL